MFFKLCIFICIETQSTPIACPPKKVRGHTRKQAIWDLENNERIVVTFDSTRQPIRNEGVSANIIVYEITRCGNNIQVKACQRWKSKISKSSIKVKVKEGRRKVKVVLACN